MRVLILTHGTRGDVQPFVALARALAEAGHDPLLAAPVSSRALVESHGIRFAPLDDGPNQLLDDPELVGSVAGTGKGDDGPWRARGRRLREIPGMLRIMRQAKPGMARVLADMSAAAEQAADADVVVHGLGYPGHHIAEYLGVPAVPVALQPAWVPTAAFPNPMLPVPVPQAWNRASYRFSTLALRSFAGIVDAWREHTLGLARRPGRHDALRRPGGAPARLLQAYSRHLVPDPDDYPDRVHTTGHWFLAAQTEWAPSPELAEFLDAGEAPVFIGFSSMPSADPAALGRLVVDAVRRVGKRAVLATGWGGLATAERAEDILVVPQLPHDWAFPRMSAVVHAGGAGTVGAALAAGRPQVVCPFHLEQRFWAQRVHAIGAATEPLQIGRITAAVLAARIGQAVGDAGVARSAREVGADVRAEGGTARAVALVEAEAEAEAARSA